MLGFILQTEQLTHFLSQGSECRACLCKDKLHRLGAFVFLSQKHELVFLNRGGCFGSCFLLFFLIQCIMCREKRFHLRSETRYKLKSSEDKQSTHNALWHVHPHFVLFFSSLLTYMHSTCERTHTQTFDAWLLLVHLPLIDQYLVLVLLLLIDCR